MPRLCVSLIIAKSQQAHPHGDRGRGGPTFLVSISEGRFGLYLRLDASVAKVDEGVHPPGAQITHSSSEPLPTEQNLAASIGT